MTRRGHDETEGDEHAQLSSEHRVGTANTSAVVGTTALIDYEHTVPGGLTSNVRMRRAKLLFDAAEQFGESSARDAAAELARLDLYRTAAFWGLSALAPPETPQSWPGLLLGFSLGVRAEAVLARTPVEDESCGPEMVGLDLDEARRAALRVFEVAEAPTRAESAHRQRQITWLAAGLLAGLVICAFFIAYGTRIMGDRNLAEGRPWRASSKLLDCHPDQLECGGVRTAIFFHTVEENEPWVEFDLGSPTQFSRVVVQNRTDDVTDRSAPLILEVGDDQRTWRQLGRRETEFSTWEARFEPTTARYVRVRSPRRTLLHLEAVRVYP